MPTPRKSSAPESVNDIRAAFLDYFAQGRPRREAVLAAGAAGRSDAAVHQCRHGAVQEHLHRRREALCAARGDVAEMRARRRQAQRPRQCRLHGAPPHLLRDARQLLVRRLFQGAGDRARLDAGHQRFRPAEGQAARHRLSRRRRGGGLWKKIAGLPDDRIIRIATSDNFWSMGDTGPCGPCSEIFIDRGDHIWGGPPGSAEQDGDRFLEFWNLVFMQFEQFGGRPRASRCRSPRSTPAWGSSASPPSCRASSSCSTPTSSAR